MTYLSHYGVKGMQWGVTRTQRQIDMYNRVAMGKGSALDNIKTYGELSLIDLAQGKSSRSMLRGKAAVLQARNDRLNSGKGTKRDKLASALNANVADVLLNR